LSEVFGKEVRAFLVTTGTAANGLSLASIAPPYGAVICHAEAHISCDECNSPEFFTGGAKILGLHGPGGKITPPMIEKTMKGFIRGEHDPKPAAVSIANVTELGTVYSPAGEEISAQIRPRGMKLHMDGARFGTGGGTRLRAPAEVTWKAGRCHVLRRFEEQRHHRPWCSSILNWRRFLYQRMRSALVSKPLSRRMLAYLRDGLWLDNARMAMLWRSAGRPEAQCHIPNRCRPMKSSR
jgi:threonine aldolase